MGSNAGHKALQYPQERVMGTLTRREREVLVLLAAGRSTIEIADELRVSRLTARNHIIHVMEKLGAHSRVQAVVMALQGEVPLEVRRDG